MAKIIFGDELKLKTFKTILNLQSKMQLYFNNLNSFKNRKTNQNQEIETVFENRMHGLRNSMSRAH